MKQLIFSLLAILCLSADAQFFRTYTQKVQTYGQESYKDAIDLGRIPNKDNPPDFQEDWLVTSYDLNLSSRNPEQWFVFTGTPNRRYFFHVTNLDAPKNFPVIITFFTTVNGRPAQKDSIIADQPLLLNCGFYFNTPGGGSKNQKYYLLLSMENPRGRGTLTCDLNVHETPVWSPNSVSFQNPRWNSANSGQWTMDVPSAMEGAYIARKPVLLYLTGLHWDPSSICHANAILPAISSQINMTYPVMLDNCEADGTGPAILKDYMPNGYLEKQHISDEAADSQLDVNKQISKDYALPGASSVPYPTFIYCRMVHLGGNDFVMEPVGRFGPDVTDSDTAITLMNQLNKLFQQGHREASQYPETSSIYIDPETQQGNDVVTLGGPATCLWIKFTANSRHNEGKSWMFTISPKSKVPAGSKLALEVYDSTGKQRLQQVSATTPQDPVLTFIPPNRSKTQYWLKISAPGLNELADMTLVFQQREIISELTVPVTSLSVTREDRKVHIPLQLEQFGKSDEPIAFQYRTAPAPGSNAAPSSYYDTFTGWRTFTWKDLSQNEDQLSLNITVPGSAPVWSGSKDFLVQFQAVTYTCSIPGNNQVTVKIHSLPAFNPQPPATIQLFKGLAVDMDFPISPVGDTGITVQGDLPEGLRFDTQFLNDSQAPRLKLIGVPTKATTGNQAVQLNLTWNGKTTNSTPHVAKISFNVKDIDIPAAKISAFAGLLKNAKKDNQGTILLKKDSIGLTTVIQTKDSQQPQEIKTQGWSNYNPTTQQLTLDATLSDRTKLHVTVGAKGAGTATLTGNGKKLTAGLNPVTAKPQDFNDVYTAAVTDSNGHLQGTLSMTVNQDGRADLTLRMRGQQTPVQFQSLVYDQDQSGAMDLWIPWNWNGQIHLNSLSLALQLATKTQRQNLIPQNWLTDDGKGTLELEKETIPLTFNGAVFSPDTSITDALQGKSLTANLPPISNLSAVIPTAVKLYESSKFAFAPQPQQGQLATNLKALNIKPDGSFSMTVMALIPQGNSPIRTDSVTVNGVMIPVDRGESVPVGYGTFRYPTSNGDIYDVVFYPGATPEQLTRPAMTSYSFDHSDIKLTCSVASQAVLCRSKHGEQRIITWLQQSQGNLSLPISGAPWFITAIPSQTAQAESPACTLGTFETKTLTYNPADHSSFLKPGWNLVAVPPHLAVEQGARFTSPEGLELPCLQFDESDKTLVKATELKSGYAYWLYLGKTPMTFTFNTLSIPTPHTPEISTTWVMRAYPKESSNTTAWKYDSGHFLLVPPTEKLFPVQGVWIRQN